MRIRLNQEYRNKTGVHMKTYSEQENTHEKKISFVIERNLKLSKIKLGNLPKSVCQDNIQKKMWTWHIIFKTNIQM